MPVYIALLRGINIGPHKRMKMEKLRACCGNLGFDTIKTYIQSGNLVFKAAKADPATLAKKIEAQITKDFGFSADVIVRTQEQLEQVVRKNPLLKEAGIDESKLHVVFLAQAPTEASIKKLETVTKAPDRVRHSGSEVYFYFPHGVSGSSIWKQNLDKLLLVSGTMRNWRTVNTLHQMASECE